MSILLVLWNMIKNKKKIEFVGERLVNLQTKAVNNLNKLCDFDIDNQLNNVYTLEDLKCLL